MPKKRTKPKTNGCSGSLMILMIMIMMLNMIMMMMMIELKMMVVMMNLSFWRILFFSAVTWIVMIKVGGNLFGASIELDISAPI